ncbi:MAG: LuxR C-terminal-related transcriptional regulator [Muribaculaceae bacterium]|nr:LuxR C-terminal-related transcriptional regulator [Muribaculaceae bacterium]
MNSIRELEDIMAGQAAHHRVPDAGYDVLAYGRAMAAIENSVVVVSDMARKTSRIFPGEFARVLGLRDCTEENSIWEKTVLSHLSEEELEAKVAAELRFYHFVRGKPRTRRHYYLLTRLRFRQPGGSMIDVAHRMHYVYDARGESITHAVCTYAPLTFDFKGRSIIVDSVSGICSELAPAAELKILSPRERQVLTLIADGRKSNEIASQLHLSVHTVSRHRQEILSKLRVRNSIDACRLAASLGLI